MKRYRLPLIAEAPIPSDVVLPQPIDYYYLASEVDARIAALQEEADRRTREVESTYLVQKRMEARIAELERALRAAHQYMMPSVNRGPAYASWCMAIEIVEPLIGESEGRSLIAQCGL